MKSKLNVFRALSAVYARRMIKLVTIIGLIVFAVVFILISLLAYFFSNWWWLLLIPHVLIGLILTTIIIVAHLIASSMYPWKFTAEQTQQLTDFADKTQRLIEVRAISIPLFAFTCLKDLLLYRDLRTVKNIVNDSTTLREDFRQLENNLRVE